MKITANFNDFKAGLDKLNKITVKKGKEATILGSILITADNDNIALIKTNLTTKIHCKITDIIEETGKVVIPEETLGIVSDVKHGENVIITDEYIQIGKKVLRYVKQNVDHYPNTDIISNNFQFAVTEQELARLLTCTYACAKDDIRPMITGVHINNNEFVGCNGYYMSVRHSEEFESDLNITTDIDTCNTLQKILDKKSTNKIKVYTDEKQKYIMFEFSNYCIEGKLLEGEYINYKAIIPDVDNYTTILDVTDDELQEKLKLMYKIVKNKDIPLIKLNITDNVTINCKNQEHELTDEINCVQEGSPLLIGFNCKYLIDVTKQYEQNFKMYLRQKTEPVIITQNHKDLELLLPVRI